MEVHLRSSTAERIRSALGPDVLLSPADVPTVLARLAVEAPDVYSQVLSEISGSQVRLDSEQTLTRRWRRSLLRRLLFWWAEYESETGDRLIAKRHVAAAIPIGLAVSLLFLVGVSHLAGHRPARVAAPGRPSIRVLAGIALPQLPPRTVPLKTPASRKRALARGVTLPGVPDLGPADSALLAIPALAPPLSRLGSVGDAASVLSPVVFTRQTAFSGSTTAAAARPDTAGSPSPIVYDRSAEGPRTGTSAVGGGPATGSAGGWFAGQRVPAHLVTGVVTAAGGPPMPVVAESTDPPRLWLGRATVGAEGRVQITFSPQGVAEVHGVALDPARLAPGLAGRTALRQPQAAGMALAASMQAATDYVQALARQGQVTLTNGWAQVIDGSPAPPWTYLASRLAQGLTPQGTGSTPVTTVELDPGTSLVILLVEVP